LKLQLSVSKNSFFKHWTLCYLVVFILNHWDNLLFWCPPYPRTSMIHVTLLLTHVHADRFPLGLVFLTQLKPPFDTSDNQTLSPCPLPPQSSSYHALIPPLLALLLALLAIKTDVLPPVIEARLVQAITLITPVINTDDKLINKQINCPRQLSRAEAPLQQKIS